MLTVSTWAQIALALLKLTNWIVSALDREQFIKQGYDSAVAKEAEEILKMTSAGKAILDKVNRMSDDEVDDALRGLEPR